MKYHNRVYRLMVLPVFIILTLFMYWPVLRGGFIAFQHYTLFDLSKVRFNGFDNFLAIIKDADFPFFQILLNTLIWLFASLILQFILGFSLALLLQKPFPLRGLYSGLVFYSWTLSGFAIGLVWAWIFNGQFGLANDILLRIGLIESPIGFLSNQKIAIFSVVIANVWYGVPFFAIMLLAALQSIPKELYESAELDGAGPFVRMFSITIPYILPTIISTTLLRTMWIMNFPDIIYAMTGGGPANSTNILATQMINKIQKSYNYGQGSAVGVMIIFILLIYAILYLKIVNRGDEK
ncbi:sugar ABC transporter permease [Treponema socranskii]|uniref:carbohydrate ABC transporter permease n=1 Tax=Treponema socranskii TaxID=53419 RepID=UPI003D6F5509